jgi:hypothetical protein
MAASFFNYILATGGMVHCLRILFPATSGIQWPCQRRCTYSNSPIFAC